MRRSVHGRGRKRPQGASKALDATGALQHSSRMTSYRALSVLKRACTQHLIKLQSITGDTIIHAARTVARQGPALYTQMIKLHNMETNKCCTTSRNEMKIQDQRRN